MNTIFSLPPFHTPNHIDSQLQLTWWISGFWRTLAKYKHFPSMGSPNLITFFLCHCFLFVSSLLSSCSSSSLWQQHWSGSSAFVQIFTHWPTWCLGFLASKRFLLQMAWCSLQPKKASSHQSPTWTSLASWTDFSSPHQPFVSSLSWASRE